VATARFKVAAEVFDDWRDELLAGRPPQIYPVGAGPLLQFEVGPGVVSLIGGPPGVGKTALTTQMTVDALRLTPTLKALICNVEMPPVALLDRQLARLSGVQLNAIRHRALGSHHSWHIDVGLNTLSTVADRLCFVLPPFNLANVAACADEFGASLVLLDYIQRIPPPGNHADRRASVDTTMDYLRQFADAGVAVLVVSAVSRSKDRRGRSTYDDGLNLASYRESSELEFGADSAYMLVLDNTGGPGQVILRHLKDRHAELRDIPLRFDGARQSFTS